MSRGRKVPWMCAGDFNDIADEGEKKGGQDKAKRNICSFQ